MMNFVYSHKPKKTLSWQSNSFKAAKIEIECHSKVDKKTNLIYSHFVVLAGNETSFLLHHRIFDFCKVKCCDRPKLQGGFSTALLA
jgi:hypothetical protein